MLTSSSRTDLWRALVKGLALFSIGASVALSAQDFHSDRDKREAYFWPGNLVVSRSVYDNNPNNVKVGTILRRIAQIPLAVVQLPPALPTTAPIRWSGTMTFTTPASASPRKFFSTRLRPGVH
jgi:hypothetical protein